MLFAAGLLPLTDMVRKRKLQFVSSLFESSNTVIKYVSSVLGSSLKSSFFSSIRDIESIYNVSCRDSRRAIFKSIRDFTGRSISEVDRDRAVIAIDWLKRPLYVCRGFYINFLLGTRFCSL